MEAMLQLSLTLFYRHYRPRVETRKAPTVTPSLDVNNHTDGWNRRPGVGGVVGLVGTRLR